MDRAVSVCFSPASTVSKDIGESTGRQGGGGDSHSHHMAKEVLVHPLASDGMRDSVSLATQHGSSVTVAAGEGHALPLRAEDPQVGGLEAERQTLEGAGLSAEVIGTALASSRPASRRVYDGRWRAFLGWCDE